MRTRAEPGAIMTTLLETGPPTAPFGLILAHGAGAAMTSPFMDKIAALLAERAIAVTRFEFAYMAQRREGGSRRPPPKAERLVTEYAAIVERVSANAAGRPLFVGGKSMGGRVASLLAADVPAHPAIKGLVCLGYPFHPPAKPEQLRTAHLANLTTPALIVQGERDPFGNRSEAAALKLPPRIEMHWIGDGDHDFAPRAASGFTRKGNLVEAADAIAAFMTKTVSSR